MQVWNVRHVACWKCRRQKIAKKSPSRRHCTTLLSSNISSRCPYNKVNFGLLAAEIDPVVWGTPANFNGFRVLTSLLQRRRSTEANQTAQCLALTWAGRLYIHFRLLLLHNGILPGAKFTFRPRSLALSYSQRYCTAVEQWARAKLRRWAQGATYIRQGDHRVGHSPTF